MTTQSRMFFVKSFKGFRPLRRAACGLKTTYTKRNCMASKYISGLRDRDAAGFTTLTRANLPRADCTSSRKPAPWNTLIRALPPGFKTRADMRSEEHTSELQSQSNLVCRLLLEKKKKNNI